MIETRRERLLYQGIIPVFAAVAGAIAATWFQSASIDQAQLNDIVTLVKDPQMSAQQKLQALTIYQEITDRPWSVIRSVTSTFGVAVAMIVGALTAGGYFRKS